MKNFIIDFLDKYAVWDWRAAWDKYSVKFNVYLIAFGSSWLLLPDDVQAIILGAVGVPSSWIVVVIAVISLVLRLKAQPPKEDAPKEDPKE